MLLFAVPTHETHYDGSFFPYCPIACRRFCTTVETIAKLFLKTLHRNLQLHKSFDAIFRTLLLFKRTFFKSIKQSKYISSENKIVIMFSAKTEIFVLNILRVFYSKFADRVIFEYFNKL